MDADDDDNDEDDDIADNREDDEGDDDKKMAPNDGCEKVGRMRRKTDLEMMKMRANLSKRKKGREYNDEICLFGEQQEEHKSAKHGLGAKRSECQIN